MFAFVENGVLGKLAELCTAIVGLLTALVTTLAHPDKKTITESPGIPAEKKAPIAKVLKKWKLVAIVLAGVLTLQSMVVLISVLSRPSDDRVFWKVLSERDPDTFYGSRDGHYEIARLIPDRPSLDRDDDFLRTLDDTRHTFDVAVIDGHRLLMSYANEIENAVKKGIAVRILMFDSDAKNEANCKALAEATKRDCTVLRTNAREVQQTLKEVQTRVASSSGSLQIHLYPKILLYTMWIKDANDEASMGLLRTHLYFNHEKWPSFIFAKDGKALTGNLAQEFNTIWGLSRPLP